MVDGEKDKRVGYRKHQTRMGTGVEGDEVWTRGESRRDGEWCDVLESEWSEKERKTTTKMARHAQ